MPPPEPAHGARRTVWYLDYSDRDQDFGVTVVEAQIGYVANRQYPGWFMFYGDDVHGWYPAGRASFEDSGFGTRVYATEIEAQRAAIAAWDREIGSLEESREEARARLRELESARA